MISLGDIVPLHALLSWLNFMYRWSVFYGHPYQKMQSTEIAFSPSPTARFGGAPMSLL